MAAIPIPLAWRLPNPPPRRVDAMRSVRLGPERPAETLLLALTAGDALRRDNWASPLGDADAWIETVSPLAPELYNMVHDDGNGIVDDNCANGR